MKTDISLAGTFAPVASVAFLLDTEAATVARLIATGKVKVHRINHKRYVDLDEVERALRATPERVCLFQNEKRDGADPTPHRPVVTNPF